MRGDVVTHAGLERAAVRGGLQPRGSLGRGPRPVILGSQVPLPSWALSTLKKGQAHFLVALAPTQTQSRCVAQDRVFSRTLVFPLLREREIIFPRALGLLCVWCFFFFFFGWGGSGPWPGLQEPRFQSTARKARPAGHGCCGGTWGTWVTSTLLVSPPCIYLHLNK